MEIRNIKASEINGAQTVHIRNDRKYRSEVVQKLIIEEHGTFVRTFWVDKGHKNGPELHNVYSNGIIRIYNAKSKRHITDLIARVGQVRRYYEAVGEQAPKEIIELAKEHQTRKLNRC